jgi:predicted RNA binding protein YcfA (HicA-like mRNA interferase family)
LNLPAVSKPRFIRALRKLGFVLEHQREDLRPSALRAILRDAQISEEEFLKAL